MPRIRPETLNPSFPGTSETELPKAERTERILRDTLELAGQRTLEQSTALLRERLSAMERKKKKAEGAISEAGNINEITHPESPKKITEGAVTHTLIEDDAVILNASDAHGNFDDLKIAIADFIKRKENGENVYFNYSGDVCSGDTPGVVPVMEALASIQTKYPNEVTTEFGNGDRRSLSLFMGLPQEIAQRFHPDTHTFLDTRAKEIIAEENAADAAEAQRLQNIAYGAEFFRLARLFGSAPMNTEEMNLPYVKTMLLQLNKGQESPVIDRAIRELNRASEPVRPHEKHGFQKSLESVSAANVRNLFDYWRLNNQILNDQTGLSIYENSNARVLATHTGFLTDRLSDIVYNPRAKDRTAWNKFIDPGKDEKPGSIEKFGFKSYTPEDMGQALESISPGEKPLVVIVGHNHNNFAQEIPKSGGPALRVENCVSSHSKRAGEKAAYAEIKIQDLIASPDYPENAVTFYKIR
ncbi:MAG: hypothetical protein COT91_01065 [Candidatus Doudnabacteria bacterium CG10_big_fil_rev_8_21_14_0_10_41_10]|uniref:Calcineurin-like phosphoesterase domain-containing protein n=1 Tax=Candidatus Doudnabacteria bacterium CG10_big_fil_rev_8_21_14_0_10_41_10 TaxID=1974551 RepID=A0A2H0VGM5_9BACT|nr:MAG: hypothetical protein COT91_01065 [Candidatus Doudnabacteria bacterium CG10_big_fil_rev_8_21_14_0_10_41_10]